MIVDASDGTWLVEWCFASFGFITSNHSGYFAILLRAWAILTVGVS